MASLLAVTASPSPTSRTAAVTRHVADLLRTQGHAVEPDAGAIAAVPLSRIGLNRQGPLGVRDAPFGSVGRAAQAGATPG